MGARRAGAVMLRPFSRLGFQACLAALRLIPLVLFGEVAACGRPEALTINGHLTVRIHVEDHLVTEVKPRPIRPFHYDRFLIDERADERSKLLHDELHRALLEVPGKGRAGPVDGNSYNPPNPREVDDERRDVVAVFVDP